MALSKVSTSPAPKKITTKPARVPLIEHIGIESTWKLAVELDATRDEWNRQIAQAILRADVFLSDSNSGIFMFWDLCKAMRLNSEAWNAAKSHILKDKEENDHYARIFAFGFVAGMMHAPITGQAVLTTALPVPSLPKRRSRKRTGKPA